MAKTPTLVENPQACTSTHSGVLHLGLKGWPEGLVTGGEWLDAGGPIDATDKLPKGGAWGVLVHSTRVVGFSVSRPGAFA